MFITEALAELKTLNKRIEKKRGFIADLLIRQSQMKDPMEKEGTTSEARVQQELQAIRDLQDRMVSIRTAINQVNLVTFLTIDGVAHSIAEWILWKREVYPLESKFLSSVRNSINSARGQIHTRGRRLLTTGEASEPEDFIIAINEGELATQIEKLEETFGTLDGQLSLLNATTTVQV